MTRGYPYTVYIRFVAQRVPMTPSESEEFDKFIGDGSYGPYDLVNNKWVAWNTPEDKKRAAEHVEKGDYEFRYGNPGTKIPVHIKIEKIDNPSETTSVIDKTYETEGVSGGGPRGISRLVVKNVKLRSGKYKLTASTLQQTALPPNLKTFLDVRTASNASLLNDKE